VAQAELIDRLEAALQGGPSEEPGK
jgi:hypothetical protein